MKKKIVCLFLALISILSVLILPLSAAGSATIEFRDFATSDVDTDLVGSTYVNSVGLQKKIDSVSDIVSVFPKKVIGEPSIISIVEIGYDKKRDSSSDVSLYVYVYDPTGKCIRGDERNTITIANSYNFRPVNGEAETSDATKWEVKGYKTYSLTYVSTSSNKAVIKFRVSGFNFSGNVHQDTRRYDVSRVDLVHYKSGEGANLETYTVGQATICNGSAADGDYKTSTTGFDVLEISDIRQTHFLYNNLTREHYQTEIHSVYFSIPNEYVEKYESNLYYIAYNAIRERSTPMVVTVEEDLYNELMNNQSIEISSLATRPQYSLGYGENKKDVLGNIVWFYDWVYNWKASPYFQLDGTEADQLFWIFPQKNADGSWASSLVNTHVASGSAVALYEEFKKNHSTDHGTLMEYGVVQSYSDAKTETGYTYGAYTEKIYANDPQNALKGYTYANSFHKFFSTLVNGNKDILDLSETESIQLLTVEDVQNLDDLNAASISVKYLVAEHETDDFKAFCKEAVASNETVIVMHFADSLYFSRPLSVQNYEIGTNFYNGIAYAAVEDMFLDFTLIEMAFGDAVAYTVVPLVTQPVDIIPDPEPPSETPEPTPFPDDTIAKWVAILCVVAAVAFVLWLVSKYILPASRKSRRHRRYSGSYRSKRSRNHNGRYKR